MDQNQTVDNDLQKAIDDITNNTNTDPVFSDPVAAPSSIPEGDTGELAEAIGPFPDPEPEALPPAPAPEVPPTPSPAPEEVQTNDSVNGLSEPGVTLPTPPVPAPLPTEIAPDATEPQAPTVPELTSNKIDTAPAYEGNNLDINQIKSAALRDLVPLLRHLDIEPLDKFNLYRNIFEELKDYTVLEPAYRTAKDIPNETKRAEALLYLVEAIDKM